MLVKLYLVINVMLTLSLQEKEVLFKKLSSYKIVDEDFTKEKRRLNLVAISNKFGCTVVASKNGFKVSVLCLFTWN